MTQACQTHIRAGHLQGFATVLTPSARLIDAALTNVVTALSLQQGVPLSSAFVAPRQLPLLGGEGLACLGICMLLAAAPSLVSSAGHGQAQRG